LRRPRFRAHLPGWKDGATPIRYDKDTRAEAVRLVVEHAENYDSEWAAITAVSARLGMGAEALRKWVRQAEIDAGRAPRVPTETAREVRELKRRRKYRRRGHGGSTKCGTSVPCSRPRQH
jgi:transposase